MRFMQTYYFGYMPIFSQYFLNLEFPWTLNIDIYWQKYIMVGREWHQRKFFFTVNVILNYIDLCCCFFRIKIIYFLKFILWHWLWIYHILCHYVGWIISNDCISPEFFFQLYLFWLLLHASSSLILFSEFLIQIWVGPTLSP